MRIARTIGISLRGLTSHVFRSFLAALGVVLGVAAVIAMTSVSEGARREALDQIRALGIDNLVVRSTEPPEGGGETAGQQSSRVAKYGITWDDARHIKTVFDNVRLVVPVRRMRKDIYEGGVNTGIPLVGTTPEFLGVTRSELVDSRSRFICEVDGMTRSPVCVVGRDAAIRLFGYEDPIGKLVNAGEASYEVVGILENTLGARLGGKEDLNGVIYIPLETGNAFYGRTLFKFLDWGVEATQVEIDYLYVAVRDLEPIVNTAARLRTYFGKMHEEVDYEIEVPYELLKQREATQRIFTIVLASIAAVSLLVGGIGIMNIMLANVYERMREIGTRRALGATKRDILVQFLVESVLLTAIGGIVGLGLGASIAALVERLAGMDTVVTLPSVVASLCFAVLTGVLFGTYPAWKAAGLNPIAALRHE